MVLRVSGRLLGKVGVPLEGRTKAARAPCTGLVGDGLHWPCKTLNLRAGFARAVWNRRSSGCEWSMALRTMQAPAQVVRTLACVAHSNHQCLCATIRMSMNRHG